MLQVKTPEEIREMIAAEFTPIKEKIYVPLEDAPGYVLAEDLMADEYVPDFNRSTVDGYAVRAADTFGCSDSLPALLTQTGAVLMGEKAAIPVEKDCCIAVPTGGEVPEGADAVIMIEYTEDYGDGTIGILKSAAAGTNMVFRGDDVCPGKVVLKKGTRLDIQDIGICAALGITEIPVVKPLVCGIISTGDELVPETQAPGPGQVRDVNSVMLAVSMKKAGCQVIRYGIMKDNEEVLTQAVEKALTECDLVLISGGSSVGAKDATSRVIETLGTLLCHGIAMKPGKPTIIGKHGNQAIWGLPGHPVAAMSIATLFVIPLIHRLTGAEIPTYRVQARLTENVSANHGRAQYMSVRLEEKGGELWATPIRSKSGLISSLAGCGGYFGIDRNCEGLPAGSIVNIYFY